MEKKKTKSKMKTSSSSSNIGKEEQIRQHAEKIYQQRVSMGDVGDQLSDWLEAEKMIL